MRGCVTSLWLLEPGYVQRSGLLTPANHPKAQEGVTPLRDVSYSVCHVSRVTAGTFLFIQLKHPTIGVLDKFLLREMPCGQCCEGGKGIIISGGK